MATLEDRLTLAAWNAATEGRGNVKLVWGTYTGTGEYGRDHLTTLTFEGRPLMIEVHTAGADSNQNFLRIFYGQSMSEYSYGDKNNAVWPQCHQLKPVRC